MSDAITLALRGVIDQLTTGVQKRLDGWQNSLTALGTVADKTTHTSPTYFHGLTDQALSAMFHGDAMCRRAVSKRVATALSKGVGVSVPETAGGSRAATKVQDALDELCAVQRFADAATWENLFGGSVIWIGVDDGRRGQDSQAQPLDLERLERVLWLRVIDRRYVHASPSSADVITDASSPDFGQPSHYLVNARLGTDSLHARIHRDRLIIFPGESATAEERDRRGGWGLSALDPLYDVLQRHATAWQSAGNAVANAQYTIMKLKGLAGMLGAQGGEEKLRARSRAVEMAKSMINAVLIDAEDSYDRGKIDFGNLPEMLDRFQVDVAAALDMPVTILFGRSPAGMNATGKSDTQAWHASCSEYQATKLRPRMEQLVRLLMLSKRGPTNGKELSGWRVTFPPLEILSALDEAERNLKQAHADAAMVEAGVVTPHEVALSRFRAEGWCGDTTIDLDARKLLADAEIAELEARTAPSTPELRDDYGLMLTTSTGVAREDSPSNSAPRGAFGDYRSDGGHWRTG